MIYRKPVLLLSTVLLFSVAFSQRHSLRRIIIDPEKVRSLELNNGATHDANIVKGVDILIQDPIGALVSIVYVKQNLPDGDVFDFDSKTNMLISKKHYNLGDEDGTFYYWNTKGELVKTEQWHNGKLIKTRILKNIKKTS